MHPNKLISTPLSLEASELIGYFQDIDLGKKDIVESASLAPFCAPGDLINISGPAGLGKTTIGIEFLIGATHPARKGVAFGGVFQFFPDHPHPIKCAIIDSESTKPRWETALNRGIQYAGLPPLDNPFTRYINASDLGLSSPGTRAKKSWDLAEALAHDRREFVIIDTLAMTWAPSNLNDSEWVFSGLKPFRDGCQKYGITVVALTHTPRPTPQNSRALGPIGTSFQENQADAQLILSRLPKGQPKGIRLVHRKSRRSFWIPQDSYVDLRFKPPMGYTPIGNFETAWPLKYDDDSEPQLVPSSLAYQIECAVKNALPQSISVRQIVMDGDLNERTVRDNLKKMEDKDVVQKVGHGKNTKWRFCE